MLIRRIIDESKYFIKTIIGIGVLMVIAVVLSSLLSGLLEEQELLMVENEEILPPTVLELVGMKELQIFPPQLEVFFLIIMVTNVIVMGLLIGHSVHRMREDYERGTFIFFYMQKMRPWQYYLMSVLRIVLSAFVVWAIYMAGVVLACEVVCREMSSDVLGMVTHILEEMAVRGVPVVLLVVAVGVLYGIKQNYKMHGVDYGICLIALGFVAGNAYKIPQFIGQKQIDEMVNAQEMMKIAYTMKQARVVCPFAWLNPFSIHHEVLDISVLNTYGWIAIALLVVAGVIYSMRDWQEL